MTARRVAAPLLLVALLLAAGVAHASFPRPARSESGMVVSAHPRASDAGLEMLRRGGNAVDAAVATAFAIGVTEPYSAGIGGGGFLLLRLPKDDQILALDFREKAPAGATRDMYLDDKGRVVEGKSVDGYLSVAVPGTVAGLWEVHHKHGLLPWRVVLQPAIELAEEGFVTDELFERALESRKDVLLRFQTGRAVFAPGGRLPRAGDVLKQRALGSTLRRLARRWRDFYDGQTARAIVADMEKNGGLITAKDLNAYRPTWREPLCGPFRGHRVCSMPPPSSGGVHLVQMLRLLEPRDLEKLGWHHPDALHWMIEGMRTAYADRAEHLGDPAFHDVPVARLTSEAYAARRRKEIGPRARKSADVKAATPAELGRKESPDTSHLTVVDKDRMAVSLTFTVNYGFGSGVVVPGTGVLLNDEMDDFAAAPGEPNVYGLVGGEANAVEGGKIPLSSMTPTVVTKDNELVLATGSPGGSTIITTSMQVVLHVLVYGMDAGAAVGAPRIHHQWLPDKTFVEPFGLDVKTRRDLEKRGHTLEEWRGWGNAGVVVVTKDGDLEGCADPRGSGAARGL